MKRNAWVIAWDEIADADPQLTTTHKGKDLLLPHGDDKKLVAELRKKIYEDEADYDDEDDMDRCWELVAIAHTPRATLVEFKSDRGHIGTTQVIWL